MTDIIEEIDDVITWYGSADSMTWTADDIPYAAAHPPIQGRAVYPDRVLVPIPVDPISIFTSDPEELLEVPIWKENYVTCTYSFRRDAWRIERPGFAAMALSGDVLDYIFRGSLETAVMALISEQDRGMW